MRDRIRSTHLVTWMLTWNDEGLDTEHVDRGTLSIYVRMIVEQCAGMLYKYLAGEPLPLWPDELPATSVEAQAWVSRTCRKPS